MQIKHPARAFGQVVRAGVAANLILSLIALFAPGFLLSTLGLDQAIPDIWLRFAAWLLILLSAFYLPPARDPYLSPVTSWLVVGARVAGVLFFVTSFVVLDLPATYLLFAGLDLVFAIPQGLLLRKALALGPSND